MAWGLTLAKSVKRWIALVEICVKDIYDMLKEFCKVLGGGLSKKKPNPNDHQDVDGKRS